MTPRSGKPCARYSRRSCSASSTRRRAHAGERTGISLSEAGEILARLRARFHVFETTPGRRRSGRALPRGRHAVRLVHAMPAGHQPAHGKKLSDPGGCRDPARRLHTGGAPRNRIVAPVHDAIMAEGPIDQAESCLARSTVACATPRPSCCAATNCPPTPPTPYGPIFPGQHYYDGRGVEMWETVARLVTKLEERTA